MALLRQPSIDVIPRKNCNAKKTSIGLTVRGEISFVLFEQLGRGGYVKIRGADEPRPA